MNTILKVKIILLFSIFFLIIVNVYAQNIGNWEILNEGGNFHTIDFVNEKVGWLAGFDWNTEEGILLKTENGGETWNSIIGMDELYFAKIDFLNESVGWAIVSVSEAIGFRPSIRKTENGGQSWSIQKEFRNVNSPVYYNVALYAVNDSIVYASGYDYRNDSDMLTIVKTVDGGLTWIDISPYNIKRAFTSIWFQDTKRGVVLGNPPAGTIVHPTENIILKTNDGGETWEEKIIPEFSNMYDFQFINDSTAYFLATNEGNFLCTTTDTLNSWSIVYPNINSFYCLDDRTIFAIRDDSLMKSIDGGLSWEKKYNPDFQSGEICFINEDVGIFGGAAFGGNCVSRTTDGGDYWEIVNFSYPLSDIYFIDEKKGFVLGGYFWIGGFGHSAGYSGALFFTNNIGRTWTNRFTIDDQLNSFQFINDDIGFISCRNSILKTTDGGASWILIYENNIDSLGYGFIGHDIVFLNENIGWATGRYSEIDDSTGAGILGTIDGGQNWDLDWKYPDTDDYDYCISSIHAGISTVWAVGDGGLIVKYSEQNQWQAMPSITDLPLNDVFFIDEEHGWIAGGYSNYQDFQSILLKTSDGGQTWIEKRFDNFLVNDIYFSDSLHGWAVGGDKAFYPPPWGWPVGNGVILNTIDGGESWTVQADGLIDPLNTIHFKDGYGWAVGGNGLVLRYDGVSWVDQNNAKTYPNQFSLSQNYPNPFNPSTTIEFSLPKSEFVNLRIYNILGEEVATLVSDKLQVGNHTYQFDGSNLASGVYLYRIEAGEFQQVRKMILLR